MLYFAEKISPHMAMSAEGYLICRGVPVARCGTQQYLPEELQIQGEESPLILIDVDRPEEEVFSPECMASFEGKPVTEDHPDIPDGVNAENIRVYQVGHAQNIRRGEGSCRNMLLADLVITSPETIRRIRNGKREISCGYTYTLVREGGRWIQRNIRGNHIAIVDRGRAGHSVRIVDHLSYDTKSERSIAHMNSTNKNTGISRRLARYLVRMARDGEIGALEEIIGEIIESGETREAPGAAEPGEAAGSAAARPEEEENPVTEDADPEIITRLDRIIALLDQRLPGAAADGAPQEAETPAAEAAETPETEQAASAPELQAELEELLDSEGGEELAAALAEMAAEAETATPEDAEAEQQAVDSLTRSAIRAIKPVIARLPEKERRAAADMALRAMRGTGAKPAAQRTPGAYAALIGASRPEDDAQLGKRIMEKRNANYRK